MWWLAQTPILQAHQCKRWYSKGRKINLFNTMINMSLKIRSVTHWHWLKKMMFLLCLALWEHPLSSACCLWFLTPIYPLLRLIQVLRFYAILMKKILSTFKLLYQEIDALVTYLKTQKNITKFTLLPNGGYGRSWYLPYQRLKKHHLTSVLRVHTSVMPLYQHAIHEIEAAKPEAIILAGAYKPTARFIEKVKRVLPK